MFSDWELEQIHARVARMSVHDPSTADQLFASPPAEPQFFQRQILDDCVTAARGAGLRVPGFHVSWKDSDPVRVVAGAVRMSDDDGDIDIDMALCVFRSPTELAHTIYHELQHMADFSAGLFRSLDRGELEVRAERFANAMMQRQSR